MAYRDLKPQFDEGQDENDSQAQNVPDNEVRFFHDSDNVLSMSATFDGIFISELPRVPRALISGHF